MIEIKDCVSSTVMYYDNKSRINDSEHPSSILSVKTH